MVQLVLDSGGVLSNNRCSIKHDGDQIYRASLPGAFALIHFWQRLHGPIVVVSKVTAPRADHWVVRHCKSLGLEGDQVLAALLRTRSACGWTRASAWTTAATRFTTWLAEPGGASSWLCSSAATRGTLRPTSSMATGLRRSWSWRLPSTSWAGCWTYRCRAELGSSWWRRVRHTSRRDEVVKLCWQILEGLPPPATLPAAAAGARERTPLPRRKRWKAPEAASASHRAAADWPTPSEGATAKAACTAKSKSKAQVKTEADKEQKEQGPKVTEAAGPVEPEGSSYSYEYEYEEEEVRPEAPKTAAAPKRAAKAGASSSSSYYSEDEEAQVPGPKAAAAKPVAAAVPEEAAEETHGPRPFG